MVALGDRPLLGRPCGALVPMACNDTRRAGTTMHVGEYTVRSMRMENIESTAADTTAQGSGKGQGIKTPGQRRPLPPLHIDLTTQPIQLDT